MIFSPFLAFLPLIIHTRQCNHHTKLESSKVVDYYVHSNNFLLSDEAPTIICFYSYRTCQHGTAFKTFSTLQTLVQPDAKDITIYIMKANAEIDFTYLQTTDATMKLRYDTGVFVIKSIYMGDEIPNKQIKHLILSKLKFGVENKNTYEYQLTSKEITFEECYIEDNSSPIISINEQSYINLDNTSYQNIKPFFTKPLPITNITTMIPTTYSNINIEEDEYIIGRDDNIIRYSKTILPKIKLNFEITSNEDYELTITTQTSNIDMITIKFIRREQYNPKITIIFDNINILTTVNLIEIDFDEIDQENIINMKEYSEENYFKFTGKNIKIIHDNNNPPNPETPTKLPEETPTKLPEETPTKLPEETPTKLPEETPTKLPEETPTTEFQSSSVDSDLEETYSLSYSETQSPIEYVSTTLCFYQLTRCTFGPSFKSFSNLETLVPPESNEITIYIKKANAEIDFTYLRTTDATMKLRYDTGVFVIKSIYMGDEIPNKQIKHLILSKLKFGVENENTYEYQLTSKEITFEECYIEDNSSPIISINEQSYINLDNTSYQNIKPFFTKPLPITNITTMIPTTYSNINIEEDEYIIGRDDNIIRYSKTILPKIKLNFEITSNEDYELTITTQTSNIDMITIKFIRREQYNPKITIIFDNINILTTVNLIEIDFDEIDQENIINMKEYSEENYFKFTGKNIKIIHDNNNPPNPETPTKLPEETPTKLPEETPTKLPEETPTKLPEETPTKLPEETPTKLPEETPTKLPEETPTKLPEETPTKLPEETPTKLPEETPTKLPEETPTKLPEETPTTEFQSSSVDLDLEETYSLSYSETQSPIEYVSTTLCFYQLTRCTFGPSFKSFSNLETLVPPESNEITIYIKKANAEIDFTYLRTTDATMKLRYDTGVFVIKSIYMGDEIPNKQIKHLILSKLKFGVENENTYEYQLTSKEITFEECYIEDNSSPIISINEQSYINLDNTSYQNIKPFFTKPLPITNITTMIPTTYSNINIEEDEYIIGRDDNIIRYSKTILPKIKLNFEITSNEDYELTITTQTSNIDMITIKFIRREQYNPKITIIFDNINILTTVNLIEIDFDEIDQENIINMKEYSEENYFKFTGKNIKIIHDNNNPPNPETPTKLPEETPTKLPEETPTKLPEETPTTEFQSSSVDSDLEETYSLSYSETQSPIEYVSTTLCFYQLTRCTFGPSFKSFSNLETLVPPESNEITIYIKKANAEIDFTYLRTTDATMKLRYDTGVFVIKSIYMGDEIPNKQIKHLILSKLKFGVENENTYEYQLTSKEITFEECYIEDNSSPIISINEQSYINLDNTSYQNIKPFFTKPLPITNITTMIPTTYSNINIEEDEYIIGRDDNIIRYSKTILPKIKLNFEITSNEDYELTITTQTSNIDMITIKFIRREQYNPKITIIFDNINILTTVNLIEIDFDEIDQENIINMKEYSEENYFKFTGKNIKIIHDNNNPPNPETPTKLPEETPTKLPEETPTKLPEETPTKLPEETPTKLPEETPTTEFQSSSVDLDLEETYSLSYSETQSPIEYVSTTLCFYQLTRCTFGPSFKSFSNLETLVPPESNEITIYIKKANAEIDFTYLRTTDATMTVRYDTGVFVIKSIYMGDEIPNKQIKHLILSKLKFGVENKNTYEYQLTSKEITFEECYIEDNSSPIISINEQSYINLDNTSYQNIKPFFTKPLPITNITTMIPTTYSNINIEEDEYIIGRDDNIIRYSKTILPKIKLNFEITSNEDYELTITTQTSNIDMITIKFIRREQYNPKITIIFDNINILTTVNLIEIDFDEIDQENIINMKEYSEENYFKFTGKNIKIIHDNNNPPNPETPTKLPEETPTKLPEETPTKLPEETPTKLPEETPTKLPEETPTKLPEETPTKLPEETPTNLPEETPTKLPEETPTKLPEETPTKLPEETPTKLPEETPTKLPEETPTKLPEETPTKLPEETPTKLPEETPTKLPEETPTKLPEETPTKLPEETPSQTPTETSTKLPIETPIQNPNATPIQTSTETLIESGTYSEATTEPSSEFNFTQEQEYDEPTINDSYEFSGSIIELNKEGYKINQDEYKIKELKDVILVKSSDFSSTIIISTTNEKPDQSLFVSPRFQNAKIIVQKPTSDTNEYGSGQIGIHANQNIESVSLPMKKVPLNIYNNDKSSLSFQISKESPLLEREINEEENKENSSLSLNKLIVHNGELEIISPNDINKVKFNEVISYRTGKVEAVDSEIAINDLHLMKGSELSLKNANISDHISLSSNSILLIKEKTIASEQSIINLHETSFIDLTSSSIIQGVCKEINIIGIDLESKVSSDYDELAVEIICGSYNFDCNSWKEKFIPNEKYKSAKCIRKNDKICLSASNIDGNKTVKRSKKSLSAGAIVGIVLAIVAVVAGGIFIGILLWNKKHPWKDNGKYQLADLD
ncbi:hypothetical protein M9Y10_014084 [Tritrichomonas musculus]|uniref:Uncharacterized protein n=1 Tax=Tritrichomonas musculus TaxID=1915356 RepID=A0ABR2KYI1_9EUKA